jgi:hypothetical protein
MRYRLQPCCRGDYPIDYTVYPALHNIIDSERSGFNTSLCKTTLADATLIAEALNAACAQR